MLTTNKTKMPRLIRPAQLSRFIRAHNTSTRIQKIPKMQTRRWIPVPDGLMVGFIFGTLFSFPLGLYIGDQINQIDLER